MIQHGLVLLSEFNKTWQLIQGNNPGTKHVVFTSLEDSLALAFCPASYCGEGRSWL